MSLSYGFNTSWGTTSKTKLESTRSAFNARGAILNAWLANLPQVMLSLFYFSIHRICTSICFATEWNNYAIKRRGLRVKSPEGGQRPTHFLQLPLRYAILLTIWSGILHWLLSQSLFLVRLEARTRNGEIYPSSLCVCGYSAMSYPTFTLLLLILITIVIVILVRKVNVQITPARHCSLVISVTCHPVPDDVDSHPRPINWDVVKESTDSEPGHCTITSNDVLSPVEDHLYA
jgi:hypothetical protein